MMQIKPAPVNCLIYRPVDPQDPAIQELAQSINNMRGLLEPIIVTRDGYILSGHRRFAACSLLGWSTIPCRIWDIEYTDPSFETLLCEFNRQRIKGLDEIIRESVVTDVDEETAYTELIKYRKQKARVAGDFMTLKVPKPRKRISRGKYPMLEAAKRILEDLKYLWPISNRTIHYKLLNDPPLRHAAKPGSRYQNTTACSKDLSDLLTRARIFGLIDPHAIEDETRKSERWILLTRNAAEYAKSALEDFLKFYERDLLQSQPNSIWVCCEKFTIESVIKHVCQKYCVPYVLGRGYASYPPRRTMRDLHVKSGKDQLIILILSDFDPEGEDIAETFARSMRDDFHIANVKAKKVALTREQVRQFRLPSILKAKDGGSRYDGFKAKYGSDEVHEIEALNPHEVVRLLEEAITSVLDIDAYNREVEAERKDAKDLAALRKRAMTLIGDLEQTDSQEPDS
jgi:hypothetical protein